MDDRVNVLIFGHLFVRRFKLFLAQERDDRTSSNKNVAKAHISYLGIGGRTVSKLFSRDIPKIKALQPRIVILEMGTSDLCSWGRRPESVGSDIEHLVSFLQSDCGVQFNMVCLVLHQSIFPAHVPDFNNKVDFLNRYFQVVIEPLSFADCWSHKGLHEPSIPILCRDRVHLNDTGHNAYYRSYRGAILFALKQLDENS